MDLDRLGEKIRKLRLGQNLTQEKLAELADVDPKTVIELEGSKRKNPTMGTLSKLSTALRTTLEDLLQ